jgi:hypothetical protein
MAYFMELLKKDYAGEQVVTLPPGLIGYRKQKDAMMREAWQHRKEAVADEPEIERIFIANHGFIYFDKKTRKRVEQPSP